MIISQQGSNVEVETSRLAGGSERGFPTNQVALNCNNNRTDNFPAQGFQTGVAQGTRLVPITRRHSPAATSRSRWDSTVGGFRGCACEGSGSDCAVCANNCAYGSAYPNPGASACWGYRPLSGVSSSIGSHLDISCDSGDLVGSEASYQACLGSRFGAIFNTAGSGVPTWSAIIKSFLKVLVSTFINFIDRGDGGEGSKSGKPTSPPKEDEDVTNNNDPDKDVNNNPKPATKRVVLEGVCGVF